MAPDWPLWEKLFCDRSWPISALKGNDHLTPAGSSSPDDNPSSCPVFAFNHIALQVRGRSAQMIRCSQMPRQRE